jgi:hypothetical protein
LPASSANAEEDLDGSGAESDSETVALRKDQVVQLMQVVATKYPGVGRVVDAEGVEMVVDEEGVEITAGNQVGRSDLRPM